MSFDKCNGGHRLVFTHYDCGGYAYRETLNDGRYKFWCKDCYVEWVSVHSDGWGD